MPISQESVTLSGGGRAIRLIVAFTIPLLADSALVAVPRIAHLDVDAADGSGTLAGGKIWNYFFVGLDGSGQRGRCSRPIEVNLGAGTQWVVTISGETPFDTNAVEFEVYRSADDIWNPRRIAAPAAIPDPFTFEDDGLANESPVVFPPDENYAGARAYWRPLGGDYWHFGGETSERNQPNITFVIPYNEAAAQIEIQLRAVSRSGAETPPSVAPTATYALVGVPQRINADGRVVAAIAADSPENRLGNNWFEGTNGVLTGQPTPPTGYGSWVDAKTEGSAPAFTGASELNLQNCTTSGGVNGVRQDVDWNYVGFPGEEVVIQVQVKKKSATAPNGNFRIRLVGYDGASETGAAAILNTAGTLFSDTLWAILTFRTILPVNVLNQTKWRIEFLNAGSTNESFKIRRAILNRSSDPPRWTPTIPREPIAQYVVGGGGDSGGDPGGEGGGEGGEPDPPLLD